MTNKIEVILASPPERDGLVVQLFEADGGQFAEIFNDNGELTMEIYTSNDIRYELLAHRLFER